MFANTLLCSLLAASSAFAHYTLDFPVSCSLCASCKRTKADFIAGCRLAEGLWTRMKSRYVHPESMPRAVAEISFWVLVLRRFRLALDRANSFPPERQRSRLVSPLSPYRWTPHADAPVATVQWDSHHAIGTVGIYISTEENPTNWSDFSTTMAKNWFTVSPLPLFASRMGGSSFLVVGPERSGVRQH